MPECLDCGNTRRFIHSVEGIQLRVYGDEGRHLNTEREDLETAELWCHECQSHNVRFD